MGLWNYHVEDKNLCFQAPNFIEWLKPSSFPSPSPSPSPSSSSLSNSSVSQQVQLTNPMSALRPPTLFPQQQQQQQRRESMKETIQCLPLLSRLTEKRTLKDIEEDMGVKESSAGIKEEKVTILIHKRNRNSFQYVSTESRLLDPNSASILSDPCSVAAIMHKTFNSTYNMQMHMWGMGPSLKGTRLTQRNTTCGNAEASCYCCAQGCKNNHQPSTELSIERLQNLQTHYRGSTAQAIYVQKMQQNICGLLAKAILLTHLLKVEDIEKECITGSEDD
uniref:Uncharacterized protein n=1 Tax=Salix viminalis TaxID=40686 RepID=A0A6N2MB18_SALVM